MYPMNMPSGSKESLGFVFLAGERVKASGVGRAAVEKCWPSTVLLNRHRPTTADMGPRVGWR